ERAWDLACLEAGAILAAHEQLDPRPLGTVLGLVARIAGRAHRPLGHSEGGSAPLPNLPPETGCAGGAGARSGTPIGRGISRGHVAFYSDKPLADCRQRPSGVGGAPGRTLDVQ